MKPNTTSGRMILSFFFLFYYMAMATWMAFLNIYLETKGYSGSEIGFMGAVYQGSIFLATPLMGFLADKYGIKKVIITLIAISIVMLLVYTSIKLFILLLIFTLMLASFTQPLGALIDSISINYVRISKKSSFGKFRLWGSIGWAVSTYLTGIIIARSDISIIFQLAAGVFVLMIVVVFIYPINENNSSSTKITREHLRILFGNKTILIFSLLLFLYGIVLAPLNIFLNLYFINIGASNDVVGKAFSIQAVSEIPFFFFGIYFVKKFGGEKSIILTMLVTFIRFLLYVFINDPSIAVWFGLGNAFTFSLFFVAVVEFFHDLIPENLRATGQSIIWAMHFGAGVTTGNVIIGYLYDSVGMVQVMKLSAVSTLFVMMLFLLFFYKSAKSSRTTYSG